MLGQSESEADQPQEGARGKNDTNGTNFHEKDVEGL